MRFALPASLVLLTASACAKEEAYLTLQVSYSEEAHGKFGQIVLRRNSASAITDDPFAITSESSQRRIAVHAEGSELDATLELRLQVCDDEQGSSCSKVSILELEHVFEAGRTRALCVEFADLAPGRWPDTVDLAGESWPEGLAECDPP